MRNVNTKKSRISRKCSNEARASNKLLACVNKETLMYCCVKKGINQALNLHLA